MINRFNFFRLGAVAAIVMALTLPSIAHAQSADAAIDKAVKTYAALKSVRGTLEQTVKISLTGSVTTSKATFQQEFPARLAIRFSAPANEAVVTDGKTLWLYLPSSNPGVVRQCATSALPASIRNLISMAQFIDSPRARYNIAEAGSDTVGGKTTRAVLLTPKQPIPEFTKATVWIDESTGLIRQFETTESALTRRVRFTSVEPGAAIDAGQFTFRPPGGTRVVRECA